MPLEYEKLMNWPHEEVAQSYTARDAMLYALGLGLGADPMNMDELKYVYEDGLQTLPTLAVVLAMPKPWLNKPETGVVYKQLLHAEQTLEIHKPLPNAATVVARTEVSEIYDKGVDRGAILCTKRVIRDQTTGEPYATVGINMFLRANGGFGRENAAQAPKPPARPDRAPDIFYDQATLPQAALIYRLSGDYNPLHADPRLAAASGFSKPILHGLCTFGIASYALVRLLADNDPTRLRMCAGRFSSPVFPGETIRTEVWKDGGDRVAFQCKVLERDKVVFTSGEAVITS